MSGLTLNSVIQGTLLKSRKDLIMGMTRSCAGMAYLVSAGRISTEDGGYNISNPLIVGRNPNITPATYYANVPIAQTDEVITLNYYWSRVVATMVISDQEEDENRGEAQIYNIAKMKMKVLTQSLEEYDSRNFYGSGLDGNPNGLANLITTTPTTGTIGSIGRGEQIQVRTGAYNFAGGLNASNIEEVFDMILIDLTMGNSSPDVIIVGRTIHTLMRRAVRNKQTITIDSAAVKRVRDLGFTTVEFAGKPVLFDEDCPVNAAYFLNTKFLKMHFLNGRNRHLVSLSAPWTQDAKGTRLVTQSQMCTWRMYRTHGVLTN